MHRHIILTKYFRHHEIFVTLMWSLILTSICTAQTNQTPPSTLDDLSHNQTVNVDAPAPPEIHVAIDIVPFIAHQGSIYVAANTDLNISARVSGSGFNESLLVIKWSTKDGEIKAGPHDKAIKYKFTKSDVDNFIRASVTDPASNVTAQAIFNLTVKSPVVVLDPIGKLFLERGELLDISLRYSGSPPFSYCYKFCTPYDILPCNFCFPKYQTTNTVIPIIHYLHNVGNYTLMFQIENIMNQDEKHYAIKINDSVRNSNLPIAPIVSTILAVIILMSGVALHLRFRDPSYATETANFDFLNDNDDDDWEQEFSFIQRVKYLFCGITEQDEDDEVRHLLRKSSPASSSSSGHGTTTTLATTAPIDNELT